MNEKKCPKEPKKGGRGEKKHKIKANRKYIII